MGLRGPTPTPESIKILEGTYREDRHGGGVRVPNGAPVKPKWLGDFASRVWDERVDELSAIPGLLSPVDGPALAVYCHQWQKFHEAEAAIEKCGKVAVSEKGGEYQHPWVSIQNKAEEMIAKLGAKFGMTPSDRAGLKPTGMTTDDELADLIA